MNVLIILLDFDFFIQVLHKIFSNVVDWKQFICAPTYRMWGLCYVLELGDSRCMRLPETVKFNVFEFYMRTTVLLGKLDVSRNGHINSGWCNNNVRLIVHKSLVRLS